MNRNDLIELIGRAIQEADDGDLLAASNTFPEAEAEKFAKAALSIIEEGMVIVPGWQLIETHQGHGPVLVGRVPDECIHQPTTAFLDVTGVWRVYRSVGGMSELPFEPTHWMSLASLPSLQEKGR